MASVISGTSVTVEPILAGEIVSKDITYKNYYKQQKKTRPFITKYEKAKIYGIRMQQLASGSDSMVDCSGVVSLREIVDKEIKEKKFPLMIRRFLPNGEVEDWRVEDMQMSI